jgi:hypothetical protein
MFGLILSCKSEAQYLLFRVVNPDYLRMCIQVVCLADHICFKKKSYI